MKYLSRLFVAAFGKWIPPLWLVAILRWCGLHRKVVLTVVFLLALAGVGGWKGWKYYQNLPKPQAVAITVSAPGLSHWDGNRPEAKLRIDPLRLRFSQSAAPLSQIRKEIADGIRLEPSVRGTWRWDDDRTLTFRPEADWPAATTYQVTLEKRVVAQQILLSSNTADFRTEPFRASFTKQEFYQNPKDPSEKRVVATIAFSHPVEADAIRKNLQMTVIGGSGVFKGDVAKPGEPPFTVNIGPHNLIAYIKTVPLSLPEHEDFMKLTLGTGLWTSQGGAKLDEVQEKKIKLPDRYTFFRIQGAEGKIIKNKAGEPEQFVMLTTSVDARPEEFAKSVEIRLLPKKVVKADAADNADESEAAEAGDAKNGKTREMPWDSVQEINDVVLARSQPVAVQLIPTAKETDHVFLFKIQVEQEGQLYIKVRKDARSLGDFALKDDYAALENVPIPKPIVEIQGEGSVLALQGERKLSVKTRGVTLLEYTIARVPADQINHLVSQTHGNFKDADFDSSNFDEENIARIAREQQPVAMKSRFKADYSVFDFTDRLKPAVGGGLPLQGLFILTVKALDPEKVKAAREKEAERDAKQAERLRVPGSQVNRDDESANDSEDDDGCYRGHGDIYLSGASSERRLILVTDTGILVKATADGAREVYLQSLQNKAPLAGIRVDLLAKNGVPSLSGTSDAEGHVSFSSLGKEDNEKRPVAIVARNGMDISFIPYDRRDRELDFSRFPIDGIQSRSGKELEAFLFTERGIYRPGDAIHAGMIVKRRDWGGNLIGLPLEIEVRDAQGNVVETKQVRLPEGGVMEHTHQTAYETPSGHCDISLFLLRDGKRSVFLGRTSPIVKEFLPDRMKIESVLQQDGKPVSEHIGWLEPREVRTLVRLSNLYGTPATERKITGKIILHPAGFALSGYTDYLFYDRLLTQKNEKERHTQEAELGDLKTDEQGNVTFDLGLERFAAATYALTFYGEGFEAEGGRSVNTQSGVLVSSLPFVIGYKCGGGEEGKADLDYLPAGRAQTLHFIAVDRTLHKMPLDNLEVRVFEKTWISVLEKQQDGTYGYTSVLKENVIRTEAVALTSDGLEYKLPTEMPGTYRLELHEKAGDAKLCVVDFRVIGKGDVQKKLDRTAELDVKLNAAQYNAGDEIELNITAPYTGSGLITIERDKVHAVKWFTANATSTVQKIRIPDDFDGTGYINVSFLRGLDSNEIFMSPLSYAVVPFTVNKERRRMAVELQVPQLAKPGEPLNISYKANKPGKIVVYAVDEGILQVTNYKLPDPLGYFFRKAALMVSTSQIVDLLLPEYAKLKAAAFGGDGEGRLNPFRRVTEAPVVFWSGVIDCDTTAREVVYNVPDYFNGTLKVMAVAYATGDSPENAATGALEKAVTVRGPFVLTPGVPTLAAPGDRFEVGLTVANNVVGSGPDAKVTLKVEPSEHLELEKPQNGALDPLAAPLVVAEGRETSVSIPVRVKEVLGSASLVFTVTDGNETVKLRSTLSVRPAVPRMTDVQSGNFTGKQCEVPLERVLYPQYRRLDAVVSAMPFGLAHGLDAYLKNYPHGCTEQLTSAAFCRLMLVGQESDFGLSRKEIFDQLQKTYATLRRRQNDQGAFGYWSGEAGRGIDPLSVYAMHFLIEAKAAGFEPPPELIRLGLSNLQKMVTMEPQNLNDARTLAYAIYLLTREEMVTTNYILNLRDWLDKHYPKTPKTWQSDLTGAYLAGAFALLHDDAKARELISAYRIGEHNVRDREQWRNFFHSPLGADAQYVALISRHFPDRLKKLTAEEFQAILKPIARGDFNTLNAAYAVLALKSYSQLLSENPVKLRITEIREENGKRMLKELAPQGKLLLNTAFGPEAKGLQFSADVTPTVSERLGALAGLPQGIGSFWQVTTAGFDKALPQKAIKDGMEVERELLDAKGKPVNATDNPARLGEPLTVRIRIRSLGPEPIGNVAVIDLFPGGFEIVPTSLSPGPNSNGCDFVEVREDRAVLFTNCNPSLRTIQYQIKAGNRGDFVVPPIFAESMYDRAIKARGFAGQVRVVERK